MKITNLSELYDLHFPEKSENTLASYRKSWNNYKNFMKEKFNITTDERQSKKQIGVQHNYLKMN